MNITPLYNLRLRLKNAMIQGTNLLSEDFRLKRAIEEFSPLMKAAPVFAKIGELSNRLLDPEENQKEKMLLDAITLLDAVLCTQAATGINEPASQEGSRTLAEDGYDMACNTESIVSSQPYSRVKPLIEALTTSGGDIMPMSWKCMRIILKYLKITGYRRHWYRHWEQDMQNWQNRWKAG